jgi:hypothetical protein
MAHFLGKAQPESRSIGKKAADRAGGRTMFFYNFSEEKDDHLRVLLKK